MFFFKKREPEDKSDSGSPEPEEAGASPEDESGDSPQPESGQDGAQTAPPAARGVDYSSEDALLALVEELVVAPAQKRSQKAGDQFPGPEQADNYLRSRNETATELEALAPPPSDEELDHLRQLVLGREIQAIEKIHAHFASPVRRAEDLSHIIAEAIRLRTRRDDELIAVLKTTVDNIVRSSVRQNPSDLADNLFPVMGPAIRRSITESIRSMLQDFSRAVEKSFSLTGLKWRIEAIRSGRSFSEVVLLKTLAYQVEQIFFIHAASGQLLLSLIHQDAAEEARDSEQVAAMFTVIQQFVNDSFAQGELNTLEFGDRHIYVVRSPQAYLACVVRGEAPPNLRIDMQTALELMVMDCAEDLDSFDGDSSPFKKVLHHLEPLLVSRFKDENKSLPFRAMLLPLVLFLALALPLGYYGYEHHEMTRMEKQVYQLADGPGLVILRVTPSVFGQWDIVCLKDDLAEGLSGRLAAAGLPVGRFNVTYLPYISQDGEILARRIDQVLADSPEGIKYSFESGDKTLFLSGSAPITWVLSIYERLMNLPGVLKVDISGVEDPQNGVSARLDDKNVLRLKGRASDSWRQGIKERALASTAVSGVDLSEVDDDSATRSLRNASDTLKKLMDDINGTVILFPLNKDQPVPEDRAKLEAAVGNLVELEKLADSVGLAVSLTVYGHADPSGNQKSNYELSQSRARTLAAMLYAHGSRIPISIYGMGADFAAAAKPDDDKEIMAQQSRKIELKVYLNRKGGSLTLE